MVGTFSEWEKKREIGLGRVRGWGGGVIGREKTDYTLCGHEKYHMGSGTGGAHIPNRAQFSWLK